MPRTDAIRLCISSGCISVCGRCTVRCGLRRYHPKMTAEVKSHADPVRMPATGDDARGSASAQAIVLFAHGARDPVWGRPLEALSRALTAQQPALVVRRAFLELQTPPLPEVIDALVGEGLRQISVLPVFWAAAGHVQHSLPPMLEAARRRHPQLAIDALPVLSELPGLIEHVAASALALSAGRR